MENDRSLQQRIFDFSGEQIYVDTDEQPAPKERTKRVLVKEGAYSAVFKSFEADKVKSFDNPGVLETKVIAQVGLPGLGVEVPLFLSPVIIKSRDSKRPDSKLYRLLALMGCLPRERLGSVQALVEYLEECLVGREFVALVKSSNKENPYSTVKDFFVKV